MFYVAGSWQTGVEQAWADLGDFLPRLLLALAVFVVGWVLAVVLKKVVDLLMERSASQRDRGSRVSTVAVRARRAVPRLVHLAVVLVALWTAIEVVDPGSGESPAADFVDALRGLLLVLGLAALFTVSAVVVVGVGGGLVRPMEDRWEDWLGRVGSASSREQVASEQPEPEDAEPASARPDEVRSVKVRAAQEAPAESRSTKPQPVHPDQGEDTPPRGPRGADETQVLPASSAPNERHR